MIEVDLPDGSVAEFPDGTAPDVIKGALRKRFNMPPVAADAGMFKNASGVSGEAGVGPLTADEQTSNREGKSNRADAQPEPFPRVKWDMQGEIVDMISFGLAKKLASGANATFDATGNALRGGPFNIGERYNNELEEFQAAQRDYGEQHPYRKIAGQGLGLGMGIAKLPAVAVGSKLGLTGTGAKLADAAATGFTYGGISGAARDADSMGERAANTGWGAGLGTVIGPAAVPVAKGLGGLVSKVKERVVNPTVEAIKSLSQQGYKQAENAGLVFSPEAYARTVDDITAEAARRGIGKGDFAEITQQENPVVTALIGKMNKAKGAQTGPEFMDAEIMRRVAAESKDPAASMVAGKLRNMIDKAGKEDFIAGNVDEGLSGIAKGRDNWARMNRAQAVDDAIESAKNAVGANYTTAGYQTAVRQKFRAIADSEDFARWPKEEQEAILRVVRGAPVENFLRGIGRWSPKGPISGTVYGALAMKFPYLVAPVAGATAASRMVSNRMGIKAAEAAERMVKGGKLVRPDTQQLENVIRALLSVQAGRVGGELGPR